ERTCVSDEEPFKWWLTFIGCQSNTSRQLSLAENIDANVVDDRYARILRSVDATVLLVAEPINKRPDPYSAAGSADFYEVLFGQDGNPRAEKVPPSRQFLYGTLASVEEV